MTDIQILAASVAALTFANVVVLVQHWRLMQQAGETSTEARRLQAIMVALDWVGENLIPLFTSPPRNAPGEPVATAPADGGRVADMPNVAASGGREPKRFATREEWVAWVESQGKLVKVVAGRDTIFEADGTTPCRSCDKEWVEQQSEAAKVSERKA